MRVRETEDGYVVEFFPQAKVVEVKEEPERGWKVEIGYLENEDVFVPARVFYDKRFTLEEVVRYARRLEECKICNSLNMNVTNVEEIVADDKLKDYVKKAKEMRMRAAAVKGNGEKKEKEEKKITEKPLFLIQQLKMSFQSYLSPCLTRGAEIFKTVLLMNGGDGNA